MITLKIFVYIKLTYNYSSEDHLISLVNIFKMTTQFEVASFAVGSPEQRQRWFSNDFNSDAGGEIRAIEL